MNGSPINAPQGDEAERDYQLSMLYVCSYGYTEENTFREAGKKSLEETKRTLKALDDHAEKMSNRDQISRKKRTTRKQRSANTKRSEMRRYLGN